MGGERVTVGALAELTGASEVTIRRDLADLEGQGQLKRVHGGAVRVATRGAPMPHTLRATEHLEEKRAIAAVVATLVGDDESVVLDAGTTLVAVAHELVGRRLTVFCLSLHAAVAVGSHRSTQVIVPGGVVDPGGLAAGAAAALPALHDLRADVAVLGACSASPTHGLTATTWEDAQIKRAIVACANRRILATTAEKLTRTSSFRFAGLDEIDDLVTTDDAPAALLEQFRDAGVDVHPAPSPAADDGDG